MKDYENLLTEQKIYKELKEKLIKSLKDHLSLSVKYYEIYLKTELGEGAVSVKIAEGLEKLLSDEEKKEHPDFLRLNNQFDYNSLFNENPHIIGARISNRLKRDIQTYNDLAKNCYDFYKNPGFKWKDDKKAYSYYLFHLRNLGEKSIKVILSHLESINFNFSKEYAEEVFKKQKETF